MPLERKASEMVRAEIAVRGWVQGVNFRWFTQRRATELGLMGFVRNLPDGSVQVVAEGKREALDRLIDLLRTGPSGASVESVEPQWGQPSGEYRRFEIRY